MIKRGNLEGYMLGVLREARRIIKAGLIIVLLSFVMIGYSPYVFLDVAKASSIPFAWTPNPPGDKVLGYRLYFGQRSRFNSSGNLKPGFQYEYYLDLRTRQLCHGKNYKNCQVLNSSAISCNKFQPPDARCSVINMGGINYYTLRAYNANEISGFSNEIRYPSPVADILGILLSK